MARKPPVPACSEKDRRTLETWAHSRTEETRLVERARMIIGCLEGKPVSLVAQDLKTRPNTVIEWRHRFEKEGIKALHDRPRSGKPSRYGADFRKQVLEVLEQPAPSGQATWDGRAVAERLKSSPDAVWRVLRKEAIFLSRHRTWCVSTDPEFAAKSADIIGLYLAPPQKALVLCVDEKPSIQALERATGYVQTSSGKIVRGLKSTYKRHGTINLFAALNVARGTIQSKTTVAKKRPDFQAFMDEIVTTVPDDKDIHVILDNYCTH